MDNAILHFPVLPNSSINYYQLLLISNHSDSLARNSSHNSSGYLVDLETSRYAMQVMYPVSIAWISVGFLVCFVNGLLVKILTKLLSARRNFYWAVLQLSLADFVVGLMSIYVGAKRTYYGALNLPQLSPPWECAFDMGFLIFSVFISVAQTLGLAFDRLVTVACPVLYHSVITPYHLQWFNIALWTFDFLFVGYGIIWQKQDVPYAVVCTAPGIFSVPYFTAFLAIIITLSCLVIVVYAAILIIVHQRIRRTIRARGDVKKCKKQLETHVLGCLTTLIGVYMATWFTSTIAMEVSNIVKKWIAIVGAPYFWGMMTVNSATNFVLYIFKHDEIRREFLRLFSGFTLIQVRLGAHHSRVSPSKAQQNVSIICRQGAQLSASRQQKNASGISPNGGGGPSFIQISQQKPTPSSYRNVSKF